MNYSKEHINGELYKEKLNKNIPLSRNEEFDIVIRTVSSEGKYDQYCEGCQENSDLMARKLANILLERGIGEKVMVFSSNKERRHIEKLAGLILPVDIDTEQVEKIIKAINEQYS